MEVLRAGDRAKDLVKQILTFSRHSEQERKPVAIVPIIREAFGLLRSSLPSTIRIEEDLEINPEDGIVMADSTRIHQVLMNLCTNAAHAMREKGGTLSVRISEIENGSTDSSHPDLKDGPYVSLCISDTGAGMSAAVMERIFDPYFTTKIPGEGTGLGLSVVRGIVKNHEGKITVDSEPGRGTTFHIFLPKIAEPAATEAEDAEHTPPSGSGRILFVDDEQTLVDLGKEMLECLGYHVTGMTNSRDALETFRARPDEFDVVITDMTMPDITGRDLAKKLMKIRADIPVVLCTGFSDQINAKQAECEGICDFVMKPYDYATLAKSIRKVLNNGDSFPEH
jgi:CheY-like chemotaxis protein